MASTGSRSIKNIPFKLLEKYFYLLAKLYIKLKKPTLIVVAGSIGKTSTKMTLGQMLSSCRHVSYMDESYNSGIGLPLSVFELKTPAKTTSPVSWLKNIVKAKILFLQKGPEYMVLEYGIDSPGEMDTFIQFAKPDYALLTAITPEHMEFLKDIETVAKEETKVLYAAKVGSVVSADYAEAKYSKNLNNVYYYGKSSKLAASYKIKNIDTKGSEVDFKLSGESIEGVKLPLVAEHLINHTAGAVFMCSLLSMNTTEITAALKNVKPTPGRTNLLEGVNNSTILDDTVNFSPEAGVAALELLHKIPNKRKLAVLGNMHELGEYNEQGFADVAEAFGKLDIIILVGELSHEYFGKHAQKLGYKKGKNLHYCGDAIEAGELLRELLKEGDVALVKGPFGGLYMEECVKLVLANKDDKQMLVRQKDYWPSKKQALFGQKLEF